MHRRLRRTATSLALAALIAAGAAFVGAPANAASLAPPRLELPFSSYVKGSNITPQLCGNVTATSYMVTGHNASYPDLGEPANVPGEYGVDYHRYQLDESPNAAGCFELRGWVNATEGVRLVLSTGEAWDIDVQDAMAQSPEKIEHPRIDVPFDPSVPKLPPLFGHDLQTISMAGGATPGPLTVKAVWDRGENYGSNWEKCGAASGVVDLPVVADADGTFTTAWSPSDQLFATPASRTVRTGCMFNIELQIPLRDGGVAKRETRFSYGGYYFSNGCEAFMEYTTEPCGGPQDPDKCETDSDGNSTDECAPPTPPTEEDTSDKCGDASTGSSFDECPLPNGWVWSCPVSKDGKVTNTGDISLPTIKELAADLRAPGYRKDLRASLVEFLGKDRASEFEAASKQLDKDLNVCIERLPEVTPPKIPIAGGDAPTPWVGIAGLSVLIAAASGALRHKTRNGRG